jgi:hypothetical protein
MGIYGTWVLALGLTAALAAPAAAQEVELAWKFTKDAKFFQTLKTTTNQTMKIQSQEVKQDQDQEFVFSWTVKEADDKKVVLEQKIESVNMTITIGSNKIQYNSAAKDAADNPLSGFFKPLVGTSFTLTLDPNTMKITGVAGREEFVNKLTQANPQMAGLLKVILSEDQLKQMSEPAFTVVPGKGKKVKPSDKWESKSELKMGPIGSYDAKYSYTYTGTEKRTVEGKEVVLHKIEMTTALDYKKPDPKDATGLPFKITDGSIKTSEAKGTILFDAEKGRVVDSNMTVALDGKLQIEVADQKADVDLKQTQKTTTTTSDKNPAEAPK